VPRDLLSLSNFNLDRFVWRNETIETQLDELFSQLTLAKEAQRQYENTLVEAERQYDNRLRAIFPFICSDSEIKRDNE
jgi:hypothetical protein